MSVNDFGRNVVNAICDICGFKMKSNQLRKQWDGKMACLPNDCWSPKHPLDYPLPALVDNLMVRDARPDPEVTFADEPGLSRWGRAWFTTTRETIITSVWGHMPNITWGKM